MSRLRLYINDHLGDRRLDQVTLADCDHVMAKLPDDIEAMPLRSSRARVRSDRAGDART